MAILGTLLKKGIRIRESLDQDKNTPFDLQKKELKELLSTAEDTEFGNFYQFESMLKHYGKNEPREFYELFKKYLPVHSYNEMYNKWWYKCRMGKKNIAWPGRVKYFALSSGTSEASSKYIPVTKDQIKAIRKTSIRQILSLSKYDLPSEVFETGILMLGGSTHLNKVGTFFEGDLSGITTGQIPFWFQHFYKPGNKIAASSRWDDKLDQITRNAKKWDIGIIAGVPAWVQILMEKIIAYYKVDNIHQIWPNLKIYVHGGVSFEPYKIGFEKLLGKPLIYIETYLASEGFIAYQNVPDSRSMGLVLNNGLFYEFVPFNEENFDSDGHLISNPTTYMIDEVEEDKEYAVLISSCAGAWRYLIGDTIKFTDKANCQIIITGRTKHFLSLCGEHLSVDNMNRAVELVSQELNISVKEFTVAGINHQSLFAHHWYIGTDDVVDKDLLIHKIDEKLMQLNDDYKVERSAALKEVFVDILPTNAFIEYLKLQGKEGGSFKFPRVIIKEKYESWIAFIKEQNHSK